MKVILDATCCLALVVASSQVAVCQRGAIPEGDQVVQAGITDATTIITNITVTPGQPGWLEKLVRKVQMGMCLRNFKKMLKDGKVIGGDPEVKGTQAATTPEAQQAGQSINTTGVGVGTEEILLGPGTPNLHPTERGQKFIHEGARVKQRRETTNATMLPNNGGPGPNAPPGERCRWLRLEFQVYDTDADYFEEAADQAQAAAAADAAVNALRDIAKQKRNKANAIKNEFARYC